MECAQHRFVVDVRPIPVLLIVTLFAIATVLATETIAFGILLKDIHSRLMFLLYKT